VVANRSTWTIFTKCVSRSADLGSIWSLDHNEYGYVDKWDLIIDQHSVLPSVRGTERHNVDPQRPANIGHLYRL
jgi:hypothetical protein